LIAEIGDFARFSHPRELAAWLGIVRRTDSLAPASRERGGVVSIDAG
jgi:transposase